MAKKVDLLQVFRAFLTASRVVKTIHLHGKSVHQYNHKVDKSDSFNLMSQVSDPAFMDNLAALANQATESRLIDKDDFSFKDMDPMEQQELLSSMSSSSRQNPTTATEPIREEEDEEISSKEPVAWRVVPELPIRKVGMFDFYKVMQEVMVAHIDLLDLSSGPSRLHNFLSIHWELAHKVQLLRERSIWLTDDISRLYYIARDFYQDTTISETTFRLVI